MGVLKMKKVIEKTLIIIMAMVLWVFMKPIINLILISE